MLDLMYSDWSSFFCWMLFKWQISVGVSHTHIYAETERKSKSRLSAWVWVIKDIQCMKLGHECTNGKFENKTWRYWALISLDCVKHAGKG